MADGSGRADAAFDRAVAAYREGSYDIARQWVLEALAQDSSHARARDLLARLDAVRRPSRPAPTASPVRSSSSSAGPETVSIDPTVLINQASRAPITERIDPTMVIRRDDAARKRTGDDPFATPAPRGSAVSEPTIIADRSQLRQPSRAAEPAPRQATPAAPARSWRERWFGGPALVKRPRGGSLAGIGVVLGTIAVVALLLFAGIAAVRWLSPSGQTLTLTPPTGGTLYGPGLKCGTRGTDCSTKRPAGDAVELRPDADDQYVFSGFTGDCAPEGRTTMSAARTCGAIFNKVAAVPTAVTFPLTIIKPEGGTIIGAGGILCGTDGNSCTANIPNGEHLELRPSADNGFQFLAFTGACAEGETTMTAARTCGATFTKSATPINVDPHESSTPIRRPTPAPVRPKPADASTTAAPPGPAPAAQAPPPPAPAQAAPPPPPTASGPVAAPISAEDHAKNEIQTLVNNYCLALDSRDPNRIKKLFPLAPMADYRAQFDQYKSIRCTLTSPPKYDRIDASEAGGAQLKFGMKQELGSRSGGAPQVLDLIVTMVTSRKDFQSPWLIDRIHAETKPKN